MDNKTNDIKWVVIKGYENYIIGDNGVIKRSSRDIPTKGGVREVKELIISPKNHKGGYKSITLSSGGVKKKFLIHRLVAMSFLPNDNNKPEVNHKNGVRDDNRLDNLEWVTTSENHIHAFRVLKKKHPRFNLGKKGDNSKISKGVFCSTINRRFGSLREAAVELKLHHSNISRVCKGEHKQYNGYIFQYCD